MAVDPRGDNIVLIKQTFISALLAFFRTFFIRAAVILNLCELLWLYTQTFNVSFNHESRKLMFFKYQRAIYSILVKSN